jgi:choline dehydrogenase-like flavoprotein
MAQRKVYDAIVVGSGATGGWAAKELSERGLQVLILEAGRKVDPEKEYKMLAWPWELKYRGFGDRGALEKNQPIQSKCYAIMSTAVNGSSTISRILIPPARQAVLLDPFASDWRTQPTLGAPVISSLKL